MATKRRIVKAAAGKRAARPSDRCRPLRQQIAATQAQISRIQIDLDDPDLHASIKRSFGSCSEG